MSAEIVGNVIGSAGVVAAAIASGFLAGRQYKKATAATNQIKDRTVDAKSYLAAREIDLSVVKELTERVDRQTGEIRELRRDLDDERRRSDKLEELLDIERQKVRALVRVARQHGVSIPEDPAPR